MYNCVRLYSKFKGTRNATLNILWITILVLEWNEELSNLIKGIITRVFNFPLFQ